MNLKDRIDLSKETVLDLETMGRAEIACAEFALSEGDFEDAAKHLRAAQILTKKMQWEINRIEKLKKEHS